MKIASTNISLNTRSLLIRGSIYSAIVILMLSCQNGENSGNTDETQLKTEVKDTLPEKSVIEKIAEEEREIIAPNFPFEGKIGNAKIYMRLIFEKDSITGEYVYEKYMKPIGLRGRYTPDGFVLDEFNENNEVNGHFIATGDFINFSGHWVKPKQFAKAPVSISQMPYDRRFKAVDNHVKAVKDSFDWYNQVTALDKECKGCVSFQSRQDTGKYLRHQGFVLKLHPRDPSKLFAQDASFRIVEGLAEREPYSIQSYNYPKRHLRLMGTRVELHPDRYAVDLASTFSLIYDYTQIGKLETDFNVSARFHSYEEMPEENTPLLHGRIQVESGVFESYELGGDTPTIVFRKDGGSLVYFEGNLDDQFELYRELSKEEMQLEKNEYSQGYGTNEEYVGKIFTIYWAETYQHDGNFYNGFAKKPVIHKLIGY